METFEEMGRGEKEGDSRLTNAEVEDLLDKFKDDGLGDDGEYFVIDIKKEKKLYFHKWKNIEGKKIEKYIREHLESSKN